MADPLTDAANAISASSPRIRSFARMAAERIIALEHPAPPPPPPPPAGNGLILFRYGDSFKLSPSAGYGRYGVVVVGYGDDNKAAAVKPARLLIYRTSTDVPAGAASGQLSGGGMTDGEARANGWLLKNAAGQEIHDSGTFDVFYGDLSPAFTAKWIATVRQRLATYPDAAGVFLDNITGARGDFGGGLDTEAKYRTDRWFSDALLRHLRDLRAAFPGMYLLANTGNGPTNRLGWWGEVAATGVDGLMVEGFDGSPAHLALLRAAQDAGRDAYALVSGDPASAQVRSLAQSFRSVWNGKGGGFGVNSVGVDPWNVNWTTP